MPSDKRKFGDLGENEAEYYLYKNGYKILDRNYRIKNIGEIDIVGEKSGKITFFEVKTRGGLYESNFPIQFSINGRKLKILRKICELYMINRGFGPDKEWQLDGIFINIGKEPDQSKIEHLENILWEKYY